MTVAPARPLAQDATLVTILRGAVEAELATTSSTHPLIRLMAIGDAYLDWAMAHPTHYRVLGDRTLIDWTASEVLPRDNRWIRDRMLDLFNEAQALGLLRETDIAQLNLQCRALAYGLARMYVDGHLSEFGISPGSAREALRGALHAFLVSFAADPDAVRQAMG